MTVSVAGSRPLANIQPIDFDTPIYSKKYPEILQDGDLLFSRGRDALSTIVISYHKGAAFSHVGILAKKQDKWFIFHSTPGEFSAIKGGVRSEPLDDYISSQEFSKIAFYRVTGLEEAHQKMILRYLNSQLGKPFDFKFEFSDDSSQYCTELVLKSLRFAGIDLEPLMERVKALLIPEPAIPPDSLLKSPLLKELPAMSTHHKI